jgi:phosphate-selective porin OprO/OprP
VTSSRDITFMEPAAAIQALAPSINAGFKFGRPILDQRATWNAGLFTDGTRTEFGEATQDYGRAIGRMTGLVVDQINPGHPDSPQFVHLGASVNFLYAAGSKIRYRSRPESHLAPYLLDTGEVAADETLVGALEAAWVSGPFSVQSEYLHSWVDAQDGPALGFDGFYLALSYFLTGESRPYDRVQGRFARVIPQNNFNWGKGGWGAWEIAARYSQLNLSSADVRGGRLSMLMTGVNWYLHPHVKWRFDYGAGHITQSATEGSLHVFQTRFELDF